MRFCNQRLILATSALVTFVSIFASRGEAGPPSTRREFAAAFNRIEKGMSKAEVRAILGVADDTRDEYDPDRGTAYSGVDEEWRYGTSGHLRPATLGQVYFGKSGRVCDVYGKGDPPPDGMFEERDLRRMLEALGQVPSYNAGGNEFDPRKVIRAVNLLQPLGKDKALAIIDEYLRVTSFWHDSGREGVFVVLRTLFQVPDDPGYMRHMVAGVPDLRPPSDHKLLPRFPITIEEGIPFKLVNGYSIFGSPESPEWHTEYFREQGTLRKNALVPTDDPVRALTEFMTSPRWRYAGEGEARRDSSRADHNLYEQLLRLLDTVIQPEPDDFESLVPWDDTDTRKLLEHIARLRIRWDADKCVYTFLDGTTLPKPKSLKFPQYVWKHEVDDWEVKLIVQRRRHTKDVMFYICETYRVGEPVNAVLKVFDAESHKEAAEFKFSHGQDDGRSDPDTAGSKKGNLVGHSFGKAVRLPEGTQVRAELTIGDKSLRSPIFKP